MSIPEEPDSLVPALSASIALVRERDELKAQNERMREALELIEYNAVPHGRADQLVTLIRRINDEARAALSRVSK